MSVDIAHIILYIAFRAHYLDAKSLNELGMYMPRGNPLGCFVVKNKASREQFDEETPNAPPGECIRQCSPSEHLQKDCTCTPPGDHSVISCREELVSNISEQEVSLY